MQNTSSHILRRSVRSLWENLSLNGMVAGVIAAALLLAGAYLQVLINLDRMMGTWDRDVHISAYFYSDVPEDRRFSIKDDLASLQEVENILYISEGEAGAYLVDKVPDVKPILDELGQRSSPHLWRSLFEQPTPRRRRSSLSSRELSPSISKKSTTGRSGSRGSSLLCP